MNHAVILVAENEADIWPLTKNKPKALLKILNKPLLEYNLNQLTGLVNKAMIVANFWEDQIKEYLGDKYKNIKLTYAKQDSVYPLLQECSKKYKILILDTNSLYSRGDLKACLNHDYCALLKNVKGDSNYPKVEIKGCIITKKQKKQTLSTASLAAVGVYVVKKDIFNVPAKSWDGISSCLEFIIKEKRLEYEIAKEDWFQIIYPWDLLGANEILIKKIKKKIAGKAEKNTTIKGRVRIGKGTVIKSGSYIEGPVIIGKNCIIGPNCYIREGTTIGDNCKIGNAVEIKNSILGYHTSVGHLSYIGDSILGDNVNIGAGTITANLKHNKKNVKSKIEGKIKDTGRTKLGTVIGDDTKIGINNSIYPGRKVGPGLFTLPAEVIKKDVRHSRV